MIWTYILRTGSYHTQTVVTTGETIGIALVRLQVWLNQEYPSLHIEVKEDELTLREAPVFETYGIDG